MNLLEMAERAKKLYAESPPHVQQREQCRLMGEMAKLILESGPIRRELLEALRYVRAYGSQGEIDDGPNKGRSVSYFVENAIDEAEKHPAYCSPATTEKSADTSPLTPEVLAEMGFDGDYLWSKAIGKNELQLVNRYPAVESKTSWNAWASDKQDEECVFLRTVETCSQLQRLVEALTE